MIQTRLESFIEQSLNVASGFVLSYCVWIFLIQPLLEEKILQMNDAFLITAIFTITSLIRGFIWRRFFNYLSEKRVSKNDS